METRILVETKKAGTREFLLTVDKGMNVHELIQQLKTLDNDTVFTGFNLKKGEHGIITLGIYCTLKYTPEGD